MSMSVNVVVEPNDWETINELQGSFLRDDNARCTGKRVCSRILTSIKEVLKPSNEERLIPSHKLWELTFGNESIAARVKHYALQSIYPNIKFGEI